MKKKYYGHVPVPLQRVHIELTNICDFNCIFCPKSEMKRPYGYMETDLAKSLISEIGSKGIAEKITFHVMGEPTLHKDFFEILDFAQKEGVKVGLTTNGAGLGGKVGKKLLDYDLHQIDISLQTPDAHSFDLRKSGSISYEKFQQNIFDFFQAYMSRPRHTIFKFRFLNTRFPKKNMEKRLGPIRVISSTWALRNTFKLWADRIYTILNVKGQERIHAMEELGKLVSYKWNVVEIYPKVFFETYVLDDWGHAFDDEQIHQAWAGYCFGMKDHFSILHNGDVTLCCIDFDGHTAIGNLHRSSLEEILSSKKLKEIMDGFKKFRLVHPYCKRCLGSRSAISWAFKPVMSVMGLKLLKPFFYNQVKAYKELPT